MEIQNAHITVLSFPQLLYTLPQLATAFFGETLEMLAYHASLHKCLITITPQTIVYYRCSILNIAHK